MNKYFPLRIHSHDSLLYSPSKPKDIRARIDELELPGAAITEHGNLGSAVQMQKVMRGSKSILGCELYLSNGPSTDKSISNRKLFHQVVLAKSKDGWKSLIKMTSDSNHPDRFYHRPRLDYKYFEENKPNGIITFSGQPRSYLATIAKDGDKKATAKAAEYLHELFGKDNFFIGIQRIFNDPEAIKIADILRDVAVMTKIKTVAIADSYYCRIGDEHDQRILLCNHLHTTLAKVGQLVVDEENVGLGCFFRSNNFHIPSHEEMEAIHTPEELDNTLLIASMCEDYSILGKPILPPFPCPNNMDPAEYLRHLCREGWKKKIQKKIDESQHTEYADRVKNELSVLQGAGLSSYFLIMEDIVGFCRNNGWLVGPGRGSAAGCLVSYLISITGINPMPFGLIFERFYNAGRNTDGNVSFPDIDIDIPRNKREQVINYIRQKYGQDRVSQMATYQTMKGRSSMKDVLRAYGGISFDEMNRITMHIPDEAEIADDLQEMKEETGESSIIRWALETRADKLKDWCYLDKEGRCQGPLSRRFEQAMRLEGTKTAQGKHASGIVIAPVPLDEICPMVLDTKSKDKTMIAGMYMGDLEALGLTKLDILGLNLLDKITGIKQIAETGDVYD